jgi:hypothetical protein
MVSQAERRALILVAALMCLGVAARVGRATRSRPQPTTVEKKALDVQIARVESARVASRAKSERRGRERRANPQQHIDAAEQSPRTPGKGRIGDVRRMIDLDRAPATDIEALPYVGRVLAERIVANRDSCGAFGSLEELSRVRGIGEAMTKRLAPLVTFSEPSRPMGAVRPPWCARADHRAALQRRGRP